ncbi:tail fiber domain-containing protein [Aequorivita xiaoshiensis]|uniref:Tail fiber domain-containing protein n=1 Tax=Aequorivita xiaoshiensis TaxID=2874476 RepID=A0A9X1R5X3_9FLAO|nr:tail fiber domain-containing protein [Aequorivita xiaoshiensis]MCG2432098.1 tail fiber domain-containing protein [Aequorivita xiaoshiensis]
MKLYFQKVGIFGLIFLFALFYQNTIAQVGVGTTNPNTNAVLEVHSSPGAVGGLLLPSVALSSTDSFLPLSAHVAGMLVYNTVTAGSAPNIVTPGYYFNNGSNWVRIADASVPNDDWTVTGNNGLNATNNFIGTLDGTNLRFRTSNTEAFEISSGNATNRGKLRAMTDGTVSLPVYSWSSDTDTGIYRVGENSLGVSTNGNERVRVGNTETVFNESGNNYDVRIRSGARENMFFVRGSTNRIGINTNSPSNVIDFRTTGENIWLTHWENNHGNNGGIGQFIHTNASNGNRVLMGATQYTGSAYIASAVIGLALGTSGSGGRGVNGFSNSNSGVGTYGGFVGGTDPFSTGWAVYADGWAGGLTDWLNVSDLRLKREVKTLEGALSKILELRGVEYYYDKTNFPDVNLDTGTKKIGFIAQEVERVFPFLVKNSNIYSSPQKENGSLTETRNTYNVKTLSYTTLIPVLVEAIKEQEQKIKSQNTRIEKLENLVNQLINKN